MSERTECPCGATKSADAPCAGLFHDEWERRWLFVAMHRLARNLRDAGGCALAFGLGDQSRFIPGLGWMPLDEWWGSNLDGRAAPGWER